MSFSLAQKTIFIAPSSSPLMRHVRDGLMQVGATIRSDLSSVYAVEEGTIDGVVLSSPIEYETESGLNATCEETFQLVQALIRDKRFTGAASIVLAIGTSGLRATGDPTIASTEAAVVAFLRAFSLCATLERVRFNTVMHDWSEEADKFTQNRQPKASEVVGSICFFLSDASRWLSRTRLLLDAGGSLRTSLSV